MKKDEFLDWVKSIPWRKPKSRQRALLKIYKEVKEFDPVEVLSDALRSEDTTLRRRAAWALGTLEASEAVKPLIKALSDSVARVRRRAAWALGRIGDTEAIPYLAELLRDRKEDPSTRGTAAWALGAIAHPDGIEPLSAILEDESEPRFVRRRAAQALGRIADPKALKPLKRTLKRAKNNQKLKEVVQDSIKAIENAKKIYVSLEMLKDNDPKVRKAAAMELLSAGKDLRFKVLRLLLEALFSPGYKKTTIAFALGVIGSPRAVSALLSALEKEETPPVRRAIVEALGIAQATQAVEIVARCLLGPQETAEVRGKAAWALGRIGGGKAVDALLEALKRERIPYVRRCIIKALSKVGDKSAIGPLEEELEKEKNPFFSALLNTALLKVKKRTGEENIEIYKQEAIQEV